MRTIYLLPLILGLNFAVADAYAASCTAPDTCSAGQASRWNGTRFVCENINAFGGNVSTYTRWGTSTANYDLGTHKMCFLTAASGNSGTCYLDNGNAGHVSGDLNGHPITPGGSWRLQLESYGSNTNCAVNCLD